MAPQQLHRQQFRVSMSPQLWFLQLHWILSVHSVQLIPPRASVGSVEGSLSGLPFLVSSGSSDFPAGAFSLLLPRDLFRKMEAAGAPSIFQTLFTGPSLTELEEAEGTKGGCFDSDLISSSFSPDFVEGLEVG